METITRLFDHHTNALAAVSALEAEGFSASDISIVSNNADNWHAGHRHQNDAVLADDDNEVAEGAGKGAVTGGALGAGAGVLAGLGMLAIPGLGPVVAAGWLASAAVGAAVGAAAGGATGGLLGALKEAGHSDEDAHIYAEAVRRGGTLVSVKVPDHKRERAESILASHSSFEASTRGVTYREEGWERFDTQSAPYTLEQINAERARYR
ncbi:MULTISPECIES: hypothetical protein [unclassified Brevundimonas]|uniref:hypothetical protein n=1 Tax=unclassified Brevundimonas TaxID=2622653 RepID=UPI0025B7B413|nr:MULTISPECIES: hypothetical protein [unclassified Brevundimonas]